MVGEFLPREGSRREHLTPTLRDVLAIGFRYRRVVILCFVGIILGAVLAAVIFDSAIELQVGCVPSDVPCASACGG